MTARRAKPGRTLSLGPPEGEPWSWCTNTMLGSITYQALGIHAHRVLDFLRYEHGSHAGRENGNLAAPYDHLERWGVTPADVSKGFAELYATAFVARRVMGLRQGGGGSPSRYELTWLPTFAGSAQAAPPSHAWLDKIKELNSLQIGSVRLVRKWLAAETKQASRAGRRKQKPTPHLIGEPPITCEVRKAG